MSSIQARNTGTPSGQKDHDWAFVDRLIETTIKNMVKKRTIGSFYITLWDFLWVQRFVYETGAILGRARRNRLGVLMQSLSISSTGLFPADSEYHLSSIDEYQDKAKQRLEGYKNKYGAAPDTFSSFLFREITTPPIAMLMDFISPRPFLHVPPTLKDNRKRIAGFEQKFEEKIPVKEFHPDGFYPVKNNHRQQTRDCFLEGVGFGSCLPDLTEKMNTSNYRRISRSMVEGFRGNEDYISSKPDILNFNGQEDALLKYLFTWAYYTCPEFLEPLDLNSYHISSGGPFYRNWVETSYFLDVITRFGQSLSV